MNGASFLDYFNLAAGVYWPIFMVLAWRSGEIRLGTLVPRIGRAERPRTFWSIMAFLGVLTLIVWGLVAVRFIPGLRG